MAISFVKPSYLIFLTVVPLLIFFHFFMLKRRRSFALKFANFDALAKVKGIDLISKNLVILALTIAVAILVTLALSGLTIHRTIDTNDISFVIAVDSSRSMEAIDILPSRFEAAKETAITFVDATPQGTRIGVISFSGNSFIEQPVTENRFLIKNAIRNIPLSLVSGTDIAEAVITASNLLRGEQAKSVIILSDGQINVGTIEQAIEYANTNNVIVHTIGIGTEAGGQTSYGFSRLDEDALKAASYNTGGKYFRAQSEEILQTSFISVMDLNLGKVSINLEEYLLIAAVILFVLEYILINTRYKAIP